MTRAAPTPSKERTPLWDACAAFVLPGIVLAGLYAFAATWSVGQTFGGESDTGWVDFDGNPSPQPPVVVDVTGHPAAWVFAVLVALLLGAAFWVSRTTGRAARSRAVIGVGVALLFVLAVTVVFTGVQSALIQQAFSHGSTHPPILGNATVSEHRMVEAG